MLQCPPEPHQAGRLRVAIESRKQAARRPRPPLPSAASRSFSTCSKRMPSLKGSEHPGMLALNGTMLDRLCSSALTARQLSCLTVLLSPAHQRFQLVAQLCDGLGVLQDGYRVKDSQENTEEGWVVWPNKLQGVRVSPPLSSSRSRCLPHLGSRTIAVANLPLFLLCLPPRRSQAPPGP